MEERMQEIRRRVIELAAEHGGVDVATVTPDSHFFNDLHFDSLDVIEFTMELEDEFEIGVPDDDATKFQTVGQVADYVIDHTDRERSTAA